MIIRRLRAADAAAFRAVRLAALLDSPTAFGSSHHEEAAQPLEWFAARLEAADAVMFGAFVDGVLAGIAGVVREPAAKERHRATIRSMFVAPVHRGRGVAAALLGRALDARGWPLLRRRADDPGPRRSGRRRVPRRVTRPAWRGVCPPAPGSFPDPPP